MAQAAEQSTTWIPLSEALALAVTALGSRDLAMRFLFRNLEAEQICSRGLTEQLVAVDLDQSFWRWHLVRSPAQSYPKVNWRENSAYRAGPGSRLFAGVRSAYRIEVAKADLLQLLPGTPSPVQSGKQPRQAKARPLTGTLVHAELRRLKKAGTLAAKVTDASVARQIAQWLKDEHDIKAAES